MKLHGNEDLEASDIVANNRMNRERGIRGSNGYEKDLGFDLLPLLEERIEETGNVAWLDLCCGTGKALIESAKHFDHLGRSSKIVIVGVDLVDMFYDKPEDWKHLAFVTASLSTWTPAAQFNLITCVHGLHYVGDKLGLIERVSRRLLPGGRFVANLDLDNLRGAQGKCDAKSIRQLFYEQGMQYDARRRLLSFQGNGGIRFNRQYLGGDLDAGPNYTGQPAVNSHYDWLGD